MEHLRRNPDQFKDRHDQRPERDRAEGEGGGSDESTQGRAFGEARVALARTVVVPSYLSDLNCV